MKNCSYCNALNPDDAVFCSVCGRNMSSVSPGPAGPAAPFPPAAPPQGMPYGAPPAGFPGVYQPPVPIPSPKPGNPGKNWAAIAGMILGILSIIGCCIWYVSLCFGLGGLILGIVGLKSQHRGMGIAGIVCGSIGLLWGLVAAVCVIFFVDAFTTWSDQFYNYYGDIFDYMSSL